MKKILSIILCLCLVVVLSTCGNTPQNDSSDNTATSSNETKGTEDTTQDNSKPISTDWNTFECEYYGDLPTAFNNLPSIHSANLTFVFILFKSQPISNPSNVIQLSIFPFLASNKWYIQYSCIDGYKTE